jgi:AraC-like DNA-binding protein
MAVTALGSIVEENSIRFLGHEVHEHDEPHLVYVVTGEALFTAEGQDHLLRRHEAVWMRPHVPHSVRIREGGMVLGPLLEEHVVPSVPVRSLGVVPALVEVMTTVLVASPATSRQIAPFRRAIGGVLDGLSRQYFPVTLPVHPAARRLAREAIRSPQSLDALAPRHRMSARQVQRIFAAETGYSFARWRNRARLNAAVSHLLGGGEMGAAARMAGFATRTGLLRALSRETGLSADAIALDPQHALAAAA